MSCLSHFHVTFAPYVLRGAGQRHHGPVRAKEIPARYGGAGREAEISWR
jgi:hypothetical protein